jgi:hypothetical protein
MATRGGRISLPWLLGWIAATLSGRIYHFLGSPKNLPEMVVDDGVCSLEMSGG